MALWRPETTIYLCAGTGIDDYNKPYFESNGAMQAWLMGKLKASFTQYSYQRSDERQYCKVEYNYNDAMSCDVIMWQNAGTGPRWIIARITGIEWVNPNTTAIYFEVDAFCTYCGDINWATSYSLVEREHVTNDWNGGVPNFKNVGLPESFGGTPDQVTYDQIKAYQPDTYVLFTPYDAAGNPNFNAGTKNGVYDGLTMMRFNSAGEVNQYLQAVAESSKGDINNIIGVFSVPSDFLSELSEAIETIPPWVGGEVGSMDVLNNAKCYTSQFCVAQVEGLNCQTVTYKPELMSGTLSSFNFHIYGRFIGAGGGIIATPDAYDYTGNPGEYGCAILDFPQSAWVGNAFAQYVTANKVNLVGDAIKNTAQATIGIGLLATGVGAAAGAGLLAQAAGGFMGQANQIVQAQKGSATVNGTTGGNPILSAAIAQYGFKFRWYMCNESIMKSVDAFFDRFGYRVSRLKIPERNSRPFWNYVKTSEGHVSGNIPAMYRTQIENMLNSGVTFWNVGARAIGDFSNPAGNKA